MNIFNKPYYSLRHFAYEIFVKCPKCQGLSKVTTLEKDSPHGECNNPHSKLSCFECGYLSAKDIKWMGFYVGYIGNEYKGRACGFCGTKFQKEFNLTKTPYKNGIAKCPTCQKEKEYKINWYQYIGELPTDPFFGLDLYYQKMVKNKILWVYNLEHLRYLIEYLNSKIRKRERVGLSSMIATLPEFIIDRKNKGSIIKQLHKFEQELIKVVN